MSKRIILATLVLAASCSSATTGGPVQQGADAAADAKPAKNPDVITAEELSAPEIMGGDALAAIQRLRPRFLMVQGQKSSSNKSAGSVKVSIDGAPLLSVDNLHNVQPSSIKEIRYLSASDAAQRFGSNAGMGAVILIKSK
jgi:hypothetical protein